MALHGTRSGVIPFYFFMDVRQGGRIMRQLIWSFIAALLIYGVWQFFLALRIRNQPKPLTEGPRTAAGVDDDLFDYAPLPSKEPPPSALPEPENIVRNIAPNNAFDPFTFEFELQRLRREVERMREMFEIQRQKINALHAEMERMATKPEVPMVVQTEPDVSPEYDEALALARRGVMADVIATRCGISRAEADLVASLAARARQQEMQDRLS
jgi:hypothetical protein